MHITNFLPQIPNIHIEPCKSLTKYDSELFPLHEAVNQGDEEAVKELVLTNPDALKTFNQDGNAPIHIAAAKKNTSMILLLLKLGTKINIKDDRGCTVLHLAAKNHDVDFVQFLIDNKAKVNAFNCCNETPLYHAVESNSYNIAKILLLNDANVGACRDKSWFGPSGTPLHLSAARNYSLITNLLLEHGADPNLRNGYGETALHIAAYYKASGALIRSLIDAGAKINMRNHKNSWTASGTALHVAAEKGALSALNTLLDRGAGVDLQNGSGQTPLMVAVSKGNLSCVDALLEQDAKLDLVDSNGNSALDLARKRLKEPNGKVTLSLLENALLIKNLGLEKEV